ncbi:DeoR/GlpR family DNA-binding transcription regulator [Rhodoferax aquaticus]|uniref:DeoR/GlpR transcriptional regulator n=1 Tax=Rhodoferax aquaticus TaxID=2527691 RepID=A0A515EU41_9BURK|nr:DeoR/GlpR family DNA-binding transcription regulator [Rhodoferax aquaticus]QDL56169.1 DeoR/GlpR transcriptional regulator [Rhodoferax aquaticus]
MLTRQRKKLILDRLARDGQVQATPLSQELGVSEDTIRRDLRELASSGHLQRVHGGALPASSALADLPTRAQIAPAEKQALARAGAAMVLPGQLVFLDGGTTALQLAHHLDPALQATFVTHSPSVALALAHKPRLQIIMLGGTLYRHSMVNVGAAVVEAANAFRADLYFMGVTGVHTTMGLTTGDYEEAAVKRALHKNAAETVVMASHEKLGAASAFLVTPLQDIATLLVHGTPQAIDPIAIAQLGVQVVHVD